MEASATTTRRPLRPDDLFNLTFVGDVAVSPDGRTICYVQTRMDRETNEYQSDLWTIPAHGGVGDATRFTHEARTVGQPRWSPDGRWLAFLSDRDGKGKRQLWVIPTAGVGGEARRLTSGDTPVSDYAWAPDSARLAFVRGEKRVPLPPAEEPTGRVADDVLTITRIRNKADGRGFIYDRRNHLWTVNLDGAETRLTEGDHDNVSPTWSPDGTQIAFVSKRMADADFTNATELYVVADTGGEARRLPTPGGPVDAPAWSPDGAQIAFTGGERANVAGQVSQLWVIPADGSERGAQPDADARPQYRPRCFERQPRRALRHAPDLVAGERRALLPRLDARDDPALARRARWRRAEPHRGRDAAGAIRRLLRRRRHMRAQSRRRPQSRRSLHRYGDRQRTAPPDRRERRLLRHRRIRRAGGIHLRRCGGVGRTGLADAAGWSRRGRALPLRAGDPRRAAHGLWGYVYVRVPTARRAGPRRPLHQSARQHGLRRVVHDGLQRRLGRQRLPRSDARRRCGDCPRAVDRPASGSA